MAVPAGQPVVRVFWKLEPPARGGLVLPAIIVQASLLRLLLGAELPGVLVFYIRPLHWVSGRGTTRGQDD